MSDRTPAALRPERAGVLATRPAAQADQVCPRCGGSGQLRTGHGAYRTCLDCAARGILNTSH